MAVIMIRIEDEIQNGVEGYHVSWDTEDGVPTDMVLDAARSEGLTQAQRAAAIMLDLHAQYQEAMNRHVDECAASARNN